MKEGTLMAAVFCFQFDRKSKEKRQSRTVESVLQLEVEDRIGCFFAKVWRAGPGYWFDFPHTKVVAHKSGTPFWKKGQLLILVGLPVF